jgi:hypothetical protein
MELFLIFWQSCEFINLQDCQKIKLQIGFHDDTVKKQQQKVQKLTQ